MKPKHSRMLFLFASLLLMAAAAALILYSFRDNMVFFYTPTQLAAQQQSPDFRAERALRIGGLVKNKSIVNLPAGGVRFVVTDLTQELPVVYAGILPGLFREGQGVVAQGTLGADGVLHAETILAKHDETYMPRDVVDALKASGKWREGDMGGKRRAP